MRKKNTVSYKLGPEQHLPLTKAQGAELKGLTSMSEDQIDTSDIPPLPEAFWQTAVRNPFYRPIKQQLTVRLEVDVLTWLRSAGRGYQTKLNAILREAMVREVTQQAPPDSRALPLAGSWRTRLARTADNIAERVPECLDGSQCLGSQEGFELGKGLLDRVQIRAVGW